MLCNINLTLHKPRANSPEFVKIFYNPITELSACLVIIIAFNSIYMNEQELYLLKYLCLIIGYNDN
jgi:hypothetical protein